MNRKVIIYHTSAWALFITYEVSTVYFLVGKTSPLSDYVPHYLMNIALFYINLRIITADHKKYRAFLLVALEIALYIFINYWLNTFLEEYVFIQTRPVNPLRNFIISSFYRSVYFIGLSTMYGFALNLLQSRERINALLAERLQNEKAQIVLEKDLVTTHNALLRAQINPHLFFNTLNFIYNSVHKLSHTAGEAVMLLADITRYSIGKADREGLVYLQDELTNIKDLIALNQLRFNDRLQIRFECELEPGELKIVPLILLTLVENVIKYADLQDTTYPALIRISLEDDLFHFATRNKKMSNSYHAAESGIGLSNSKMRLQQAYGKKFNLRINETEDQFYVDLTIQADSLCLVAT